MTFDPPQQFIGFGLDHTVVYDGQKAEKATNGLTAQENIGSDREIFSQS